MSNDSITPETIYRWLYDHYAEHVTGGVIDVGSLEAALTTAFSGTTNPRLNEFVTNFCLDLQAVARGKDDKQ